MNLFTNLLRIIFKKNTNRATQESANQDYNSFAPIMDNEMECFKCHNLGHKAYKCKSMLEYFEDSINV